MNALRIRYMRYIQVSVLMYRLHKIICCMFPKRLPNLYYHAHNVVTFFSIHIITFILFSQRNLMSLQRISIGIRARPTTRIWKSFRDSGEDADVRIKATLNQRPDKWEKPLCLPCYTIASFEDEFPRWKPILSQYSNLHRIHLSSTIDFEY